MIQSSCSIRRAGAEDARLLAGLHGAIFPDDSWNAGWIGKLLANPANHGLVLTADQQAAGLCLTAEPAGEAEILTIGIVPSHRRSGFGMALLHETIASVRQRGAMRLFLEVSAANSAAIALYEHAGFDRTGLRRRYYSDGTDAVTMALEIGR